MFYKNYYYFETPKAHTQKLFDFRYLKVVLILDTSNMFISSMHPRLRFYKVNLLSTWVRPFQQQLYH